MTAQLRRIEIRAGEDGPLRMMQLRVPLTGALIEQASCASAKLEVWTGRSGGGLVKIDERALVVASVVKDTPDPWAEDAEGANLVYQFRYADLPSDAKYAGAEAYIERYLVTLTPALGSAVVEGTYEVNVLAVPA